MRGRIWVGGDRKSRLFLICNRRASQQGGRCATLRSASATHVRSCFHGAVGSDTQLVLVDFRRFNCGTIIHCTARRCQRHSAESRAAFQSKKKPIRTYGWHRETLGTGNGELWEELLPQLDRYRMTVLIGEENSHEPENELQRSWTPRLFVEAGEFLTAPHRSHRVL